MLHHIQLLSDILQSHHLAVVQASGHLLRGKAEEVEICAGVPVQEAKGRILQGKMGEYNDFDNAPLKTEAFSDFSIQGDTLRVKMPGCAVAEIRMKVSE